MDLVPAAGLGLFTTASPREVMSGGLFRLHEGTVEVITRDLAFPHNIEPFAGGYLVTDPDRPVILVVSDGGEVVRTIETMLWLDAQQDSLSGTNWALPLDAAEVERFLGSRPPEGPIVLICRTRTVADVEWMWWSIGAVEGPLLRSLWEMRSPGRKAHTGLLHDGIFYGAASGSRTLVVRGAGLDLELPVGNIRYMEVAGGKLWMAGDDFVGVFDSLPPAAAERPRLLCQGIGRAQAVHEFEDRVYVTANGRLLVYDLAGILQTSLGDPPPASGQSWVHDRLRALGYLQ